MCVFKILKRHFGTHAKYPQIVDLFMETTFQTECVVVSVINGPSRRHRLVTVIIVIIVIIAIIVIIVIIVMISSPSSSSTSS